MTDLIQMAVLSFVAISCGLVGPFLILKRMAMFANSLSHTILLGLAVAFFLLGGSVFAASNLLLGALIAALLTALFTEGLSRFFHLQEDASIGLVFTTLFALGISIVSVWMRDVHLGIEAVMGNADLLQLNDVWVSGLTALFILCVIALVFRPLKLVCFDQNLAKIFGVPCTFLHSLLLSLASIVVVVAFRSVGVLLVLAFLTGPFLTARLFCNRLSRLLVLTPCIGVAAAVGGVLLSRLLFNAFGLALSTGGLTVVLIGMIYLAALWKKQLRFSAAQVS